MSPVPARPRPRSGPDDGEPTVFVTDEQAGGVDADAEEHPVDAQRWASLATEVLRDAGIEGEAELSVIFVDEAYMAELNQRHRNHAGSTDVLAFPIDGAPEPTATGLTPGRAVDADPDDQPLLLGDVVICPAVAARQAPEHAGRYEDELALLVVHGTLHVLGMDHETDEERVAMQARERDLLERFHGLPARDPWTS